MDVRVGQGWDRHRLVAGRPCILGGVLFEGCPVGPDGHSDGDAVCHAIIDALLGAAGLGDIGRMFPDTDPAFAGADSIDLLRQTWNQVTSHGFTLGNIDCTLITELPAIAPEAGKMRERLAAALGATVERISIKATRGEGLGPEGRGECVTVQAVAWLGKASG